MPPRIVVSPSSPLIFEPIRVVVQGLAPGADVELRASLTDVAGVTWRARGEFVSDAQGRVDVAEAPSSGGTYIGTDVSGLWWSMLPDTGESRDEFIAAARHVNHAFGRPGFDDERSAIACIQCLDNSGEVVATHELVLQFRGEDVETKPLRAGRLRGLVWGPANRSACKGVVFAFSGSNGGAEQNYAPLLASLGYRVISLAFFAYEDLPQNIEEIPLEYFAEGFAWARDTYGVSQVTLIGGSRGGELVLLLGSAFPSHICGVIATVPMHIPSALPGNDGRVKPPWTLDGKPLPFVAIDESLDRYSGDAVSWRAICDPYLKDRSKTKNKEIAVERMQCPLLMITGDDDQVWDGAWGADRVVDRLRAYGSQIAVEHVCLTNTGHWLLIPNRVASLLGPIVHPLLPIRLILGGTPTGSAQSAWRHWHAVTEFLARSFGR